jgi:hypothetical protein
MNKYTFKYAYWKTATVTVRAINEQQARLKACDTMDKRYEKRNEEPPVGWTLELVGVEE